MRNLFHFQTWLDPILQTICSKTEFICEPSLEEILKNKKLVVCLNHATPLSWLPAVSFLCQKVIESGGGARIPRGILDKWFYQNPMTQAIAQYFSQSQFPQSFNEIIADFLGAEQADLIIFPEGANTFFGNVTEIQEFRSPRFIEIAILTKSPILLAVHAGSEGWSLPVSVPEQFVQMAIPFAKFFGQKLLQNSILNLPLPFSKIPNFKMKCEVYSVLLKEEDLSSDPAIRRKQLEVEASLIQERMKQILIELKS